MTKSLSPYVLFLFMMSLWRILGGLAVNEVSQGDPLACPEHRLGFAGAVLATHVYLYGGLRGNLFLNLATPVAFFSEACECSGGGRVGRTHGLGVEARACPLTAAKQLHFNNLKYIELIAESGGSGHRCLPESLIRGLAGCSADSRVCHERF